MIFFIKKLLHFTHRVKMIFFICSNIVTFNFSRHRILPA
nr:MAG TPA: hypothetical protein [Caudoviricetes sp.]